MQRARGNFLKQFSLRFSILDHAFVKFYAQTYGKSERDIVRTMVERYVNADKSFDPKAFARFVNREFRAINPQTAELKRVAEDYVGARKKSGKTMARG